jgi:hypothetical protein
MIKTSIGTTADIPGILAPHEKYLCRNLSEEKRQRGMSY